MDSVNSILNNTWFGSSALEQRLIPLANMLANGNLPKQEIEPETRNMLSNIVTNYNPNRVGSLSVITLDSSKYIGVLKIGATLMQYDSWYWGNRGTITMASKLKEWANDGSCIGVVTDIDCLGGEVSGMFTFGEALKAFSKPKIAFQRNNALSGGYLVAVGHDKIITDPNAGKCGSIGVQVSHVDYKPSMEKEGVVFHSFTSDGSEDKNATDRALLDGDYEPHKKEYANPAKDKFIAYVKSNRPNVKPETLTGKEYSPKEALAKGMIDKLGSFEDAIDSVIKMSKNKNSKNNLTMAKEKLQVPNLKTVLGLDTAEIEVDKSLLGSKSVSLSPEQMQKIETALGNTEMSTLRTELTEVENQLTAVQASLVSVESKNSAISTLVSSQMGIAKLTASGDVEKDIATLASKVVEYGAKDGAMGDDTPPTTANLGNDETPGYIDTSMYKGLK